MKCHILMILLLPGILLGSCTINTAGSHPNIILVFIDDLGWTAPSCYGNEHVQTEHIDRLAEEGVTFTDAYVTPQCTPSRASLLTGQHTARNLMWHVIPRYEFPWARLQEPSYRENLPRSTYTLGHALQENGYKTALLGKWHLTHNQDGYYTYLFDSVKHYYGFDYVNPVTDPTEYHKRTDKGVKLLTREALEFMERNSGHPFFIYLSHHTIHGPVLAPDSLVQKYLDLGYPEEGQFNATYLGALEHIDHSVGQLLAKLDELGLSENTLVIFHSDNGGVDREFDNAPLRYGKGSAYEGGIRVPLLMRWPAGFSRAVISQPVHVVDLFPTLVDLAGGTMRETAELDGKSLVQLIKMQEYPLIGKRSLIESEFDQRPLFWYMPLYDIQWGAVPAAAVRKGNYKLIRFFADYVDLDQGGLYIPEGRTELYDLEVDIGETNDLADQMPEKVQELNTLLNAWLTGMEVPLPVLNPDYDPSRALERGKR